MELMENYLFGMVTTQNDNLTYEKHVLSSFYVFFTSHGYLVRGRGAWGGVTKGIGTQPAYVACHPGPLKSGSVGNSFF